MKLRLQLLVESDTGEVVTTEEVGQMERHSLRPEDVGLTLAEAKQMLGSIQRVMVQEQVAECVDEQSRCGDCGQMLTRKGQHEIVFRTLFGELRLPSPRLYLCSCREPGRTSFSPLAQQLPERTAPELVVVQGYFNYHAVPGNTKSLRVFRFRVTQMWRKALLRRSQRHRLNWVRMQRLAKRWLPEPCVLHPYPSVRFDAMHPR
jgi:hypothetical protein